MIPTFVGYWVTVFLFRNTLTKYRIFSNVFIFQKLGEISFFVLGLIAVVTNLFLSPWVNQERLTWRDILGVACICTGCSIVVSYGSHENTVYT